MAMAPDNRGSTSDKGAKPIHIFVNPSPLSIARRCDDNHREAKERWAKRVKHKLAALLPCTSFQTNKYTAPRFIEMGPRRFLPCSFFAAGSYGFSRRSCSP